MVTAVDFLALRTRLLAREEAPARARLAAAYGTTPATLKESLTASLGSWKELPEIPPGPRDRRTLLVLPSNTPAPFLSALPQLLLGPARRLTIKIPSRGPRGFESWTLDGLDAPVSVERWRGGDSEDVAAAEDHDLVVVFGGDAACARWEALAPGRVAAFADRFSIAWLSPVEKISDAAEKIARDVVLWEGRGCLTPQILLVEGDADRSRVAARALADALADLARRLPAPAPTISAAGAIRSLRAAVGLRPGAEALGDPALGWTVLLDAREIGPSAPPASSPLTRTIWVRPLAPGADPRAALGPLASRCEAVGGLDLPLGGMQAPSLRRRHGGREPLWSL